MSSLNEEELQHLKSVERDIRDAEARMSAQILHIADLRRDGRDTTSVELLRFHAQFMRERLEAEQ